jgi:dienelactone hydrolase
MIKRWVWRGLKAGILLGALLLGALWVERNSPVELPAPAGPFAVGRVMTAWVDQERTDPFAPVPGQKRELLVWIWYPAESKSGAAADDYVPAPVQTAVERSTGALIKFLTRDLSKVHAHGIGNAGVSPRERSYPVAIMRAGGTGEVWNYSTLAEDLASHGYVVVGFDAPYRTNVVVFPDGRVIRRTPENDPEVCADQAQARQDQCVSKLLSGWTADIAFVLDRLEQWNASDVSRQFKGRLDLTRVGVFGHSFGGAAAAQFCHDDSRCKAAIDIDGQPFGSVVRDGLHQPLMFLLSDQIHSSDPETRQVLANIQSIYDRLPADGRQRIAIRGASHFLFSDDGALLKSHIVMRTLRMLGLVGIDGRRQLAVTAYCVHSFFDAYLKGESSRPRISSKRYPEIQWLP